MNEQHPIRSGLLALALCLASAANVANAMPIGSRWRDARMCCAQYSCSRYPVTVVGIGDATQVAAGGDQTCALQSEGEVYCWGGEPDALSFVDHPEPVPISEATEVTVGQFQGCALLADRHVECWGMNAYGGLGDGGESISGPTEARGIAEARHVSTGDDHSCALLAPCSRVPVVVSGIVNATGVSLGEWHSCALLDSGHVACWGISNGNVPGTEPTDEPATLPVPVP